jgi:hypothetical protein
MRSASPDHVGAKFVADFEDLADEEERDLIMREVFEGWTRLLRLQRSGSAGYWKWMGRQRQRRGLSPLGILTT